MQHRIQCFHQARAGSAKLRTMRVRQPMQFALASCREFHPDRPSVGFGAGTGDEAAFFETVEQAHGAVMPDQQVLGKRADRGTGAPVERADGQQHLMLLGLQSLGAGRLLAEMKKAANLVAEVSQRAEIGRAQIGSGGHDFIIS